MNTLKLFDLLPVCVRERERERERELLAKQANLIRDRLIHTKNIVGMTPLMVGELIRLHFCLYFRHHHNSKSI